MSKIYTEKEVDNCIEISLLFSQMEHEGIISIEDDNFENVKDELLRQSKEFEVLYRDADFNNIPYYDVINTYAKWRLQKMYGSKSIFGKYQIDKAERRWSDIFDNPKIMDDRSFYVSKKMYEFADESYFLKFHFFVYVNYDKDIEPYISLGVFPASDSLSESQKKELKNCDLDQGDNVIIENAEYGFVFAEERLESLDYRKNVAVNNNEILFWLNSIADCFILIEADIKRIIYETRNINGETGIDIMTKTVRERNQGYND